MKVPSIKQARKAAKKARQRIRKKNIESDYFSNLKRMRREWKSVSDWLRGTNVLVPDADCSCSCMRQWANKEECSHGKKLTEKCTETCAEQLARYRFCIHVVVVCNFCQMPSDPGLCSCVEEAKEAMDETESDGETYVSEGGKTREEMMEDDVEEEARETDSTPPQP